MTQQKFYDLGIIGGSYSPDFYISRYKVGAYPRLPNAKDFSSQGSVNGEYQQIKVRHRNNDGRSPEIFSGFLDVVPNMDGTGSNVVKLKILNPHEHDHITSELYSDMIKSVADMTQAVVLVSPDPEQTSDFAKNKMDEIMNKVQSARHIS